MAKQNYLNNRDLLKEIHKSKNTFSSFIDEKYQDYDIILESIEKINIRSIAKAKRNRADRLQKEAYIQSQKQGLQTKFSDYTVDWKKIEKTDVVFRIHTFSHIPLDSGRKKNPKSVSDHYVRIFFPPFQHYAFDKKDKLICVGKSHWEGGMKNGHFSVENGRMTNELGRMFIKLCERYGGRYNWRGYSYNDEMRQQALLQLSQVGLQFDESKSQNPFAYYTAIINASFTRVLNLEKRGQNIRDDILEMNGLDSSYTRQGQTDSSWEPSV